MSATAFKSDQQIIDHLAILAPESRQRIRNQTARLYRATEQTDPAEAQKRIDDERRQKEWEATLDSWRLTKSEIKRRVKDVRAKLEDYRDQIEAVPFDICDDGPLVCLDGYKRDYTEQLVEYLHPVAKGIAEALHESESVPPFDDDIYIMEQGLARTGFQLGILAGAIFAGCSKETVDRFERGLAFALCSNRLLCK